MIARQYISYIIQPTFIIAIFITMEDTVSSCGYYNLSLSGFEVHTRDEEGSGRRYGSTMVVSI